MKTKVMNFSNDKFHVRKVVEGMDAVIVSLYSPVIPAEQWNKLRDNICGCTDIADTAIVFFDYIAINGDVDRFYSVTVSDWRRFGFSDNNIKYCKAPEEIETNCNFWIFNDNFDIMKASVLTPKWKERIRKNVTMAVMKVMFNNQTVDIQKSFRSIGMSEVEIKMWFERTIRDLYNPYK